MSRLKAFAVDSNLESGDSTGEGTSDGGLKLPDLPSAGAVPVAVDPSDGPAPITPSASPDIDLPDKKSNLQNVFSQVQGTDPERAAKVLAIQNKINEPAAYIDKNLPDIQKALAAPDGSFFKQLETQYPGTTQFLSDPKNMAVSHDDLPNVAQHESLTQQAHVAMSLLDDMKAGYQGSSLGLQLRGKLPDLSLPENAGFLDRLASGAAQMVSELPDMAIGGTLGAGLGSMVAPGPGTVVGALAGPFAFPAAKRTFLRQQIEQGDLDLSSNPTQRIAEVLKEATKQGAVGVLTGGAGAATSKLVGGTIAPLAAELGTMTVAGSAVEGQAPTLKSLADNAALMVGAHGVGHVVGSGLGHNEENAQAAQDLIAEKKTQVAKEFYTALGDTAEASKLRARMPEAHQELIKSLTSDGPVQNIYIPVEAAQSYFQGKGINPDQMMSELGVSKSFEDAKATGGDIQIPLSTWANKVVGTEFYQGLANDIKFDPEDMTVNQVNEKKAEIQKQVKDLMDQKNQEAQVQADQAQKEAHQQNVSNVFQKIQEQLKNAGLSGPETEFNPQLHEAFFNTLGQHLGVDPSDLADRFPLKIGKYDNQEQANQTPTPEAKRDTSFDFGNNAEGQPAEAAQSAYKPEVLKQIRSEVEAGSVSKGNLTYDQDGNVTGRHGAVSEYPEYFQKKGYTKKETLKAIDKHLEGKDLTERQAKIVSDLYHSSGYDKEFSQAKAPVEPFLQSSYNQGEKALAPTFYSKLERTVEEKLGKTATPEQINGMLREIKPEERKWLGIDEFLKGKEKVSKQELLDHIKSKQIKVEEVTKGAGAPYHSAEDLPPGVYLHEDKSVGANSENRFKVAGDDGIAIGKGFGRTEQEALSGYFEQRDPGRRDSDTKYSGYSLPGGENYREMLFTLPPKARESFDKYMLGKYGDKFLDMTDSQVKFYAEKYKNEMALEANAGAYRSSHWSEPNVLAHTRVSDRIDSEGKKALHIEEIQSDWHQEGRKKGYKGDPVSLPDGYVVKENPSARLERFKFEVHDTDGRISGLGATPEAAIEDYAGASRKAVPDAPFKKTWHEFVLKRLIREAAEKGYDKITWTPGEEQADRYSLSRHIDHIEYKPSKSNPDQFRVGIYDKDGKSSGGERLMTKAELADHVGKEVADKISNGEGANDKAGYKKLSGLDLKVGGEGMKGFYDKIIPDYLNKFGKKFGAKVGESEIEAHKGPLESTFEYNGPELSSDEIKAISKKQDVRVSKQLDDVAYFVNMGQPFKEAMEEHGSPAAAEVIGGEMTRYGGGDTAKVPSLDITPQMRESVLHEGQSLFQDAPTAEASPRGRIRIGGEGYAIDLFKNADRSTFLHETGHYFLDVLGHVASDETAPQPVKDDYNTILKWLGVGSKDEIGVEQHEKFARGFEQYLMEGKAPSSALTRAFSRFRKWLTSVYKQAKNLNVDMSDDVRGVMDRMLASHDEIDRAQKSVGLESDPLKGLSPKDQAKIQDLQSQARDQAERSLLKEQMVELTEKHKALLSKERDRVTSEAQDEVSQMPLYKAMDEASADIGRDEKSGQGDDAPVKGQRAGTIAEKFLSEKLSTEDAGKFEALAEVHGFASGEDLAHAMILSEEGKLRQREVDQRVEAGMAPHSDLMDSGAIKAKALKAIHNEKMTELLALERQNFENLSKKSSVSQEATKRNRQEAKVEAQAAKEQAHQILSQQPIKDATNSKIYITGERNAAVKGAKALASGDFEKAAEFKRQQMLNHAIAGEAIRNEVEAEKSVSYLSDFAKRGNDMKDMPYGFIRQIDQLLSKTGFSEAKPEDIQNLTNIAKQMDKDGEDALEIANRTGLKQDQNGNWTPESLPDFVSRVNENYYAISLPDSVMSGASKDFNDLTLQELRDLKASVKTIADVGKKYDQRLEEYKTADIKEAALNFRESVEKNYGTPFADDQAPGSKHATEMKELLSKFSNVPGYFERFLDTMLTVCNKLDGVNHEGFGKISVKEGPAKDNIYRPFERAESRKMARMAEVMKEYDAILAKHYDPGELSKYKDTRINVDGRYFTKEEILSMALNWGNEGNRQRIMDGFGFDEPKMQRIFKNLGKNDWEFCQATWDHLHEYWPEISKLEMDVNGVEPVGVEPSPFNNEHGSFDGGYYPIAYDRDRSVEAYQTNLSRDATYKQFSTAKAHTAQGHAQSRVSSVKRSIDLSLDVLRNHHEDVIHDLEFRRAVIDVNRFLNQRDTKTALKNSLGVQGYGSINDWLKAAAGSGSESISAIDKVFQGFRFKTAFFNLAYRIGSGVKIFGENLVNISSELGVSSATRALKDYYFGDSTHQMVVDKSDFMRQRAEHLDRDFTDIQKNWERNSDSKLKYNFNKFAFFVHAYLDQGVSFPLWADAYNRGVAAHGNESLAVTQADEAVKRTFMSTGGTIDQPAIMRGGEKMKALTTAYGYMSMMWNRFSLQKYAAEQAWAQGRTGEAAQIAARAFIYTFALPAMVEALHVYLMHNAANSNPDDDKKRMIEAVANRLNPLSMVPVTRDVSSFLIKTAMGDHSSLSFTPMEAAAETLFKPIGEGFHSLGGSPLSSKFPENTANAVSLVAGVPKEFNDLVFNFMDDMQNHGEANMRDFVSRKSKK